MSSDDHKFPFLNKNADSNSKDDSESVKPSNNDEIQDGKQELLPWQKKSFGNNRKPRNDQSKDRNDGEDKSERRTFGDRKDDLRDGDDQGKKRSFGDRKDSTDRPSWGNKDRKDDRNSDRRGGEDRGERRSFGDRKDSTDRPSWGNKDRKDDRNSDRRGGDDKGERRSFGKDKEERRPWGDKDRKEDRRRDVKPWEDRREFERSGLGTNDDMRRYDDRDNEIKPVRIQSTKSKTFNDFADFYLGDQNEVAPPINDSPAEKPVAELINLDKKERKRIAKDTDREFGRRRNRPEKKEVSINYGDDNPSEEEGLSIMRLNKYIAKTGLCSRRKAADLVKDGEITVNGKIEIQPAYEVQDTDVILYQGKKLEIQEELVYLLLNKPKGYITTMDDERDRKTVMDLIEDKVDVRVFPVGRLDRNTSGLLLFTNDGDLTKVLSHPSHKVQKFYHVVLDKPVSEAHIEQIKEGLILEDGKAEVDAVGYVEGRGKDEVGIEIHIGKNRIVRRIFEHFGYRVEKLDRTYYAGLTKKDLSRGWSRHLTHKEVIMLKHFTGK